MAAAPSRMANMATAPSRAILTFGKRSDGCLARRSWMGRMLYGLPDTVAPGRQPPHHGALSWRSSSKTQAGHQLALFMLHDVIPIL
ncbi:hypothetical protein ABZP36_011411 [Zizania latifolia]